MAISSLCILRNFRKPDRLMLHYPALLIDLDRFLPSSLLSIDEELLSVTLLKFALACFLRNGGDAKASPILSPLVACDELLRRQPPIEMFIPEVDCLRDQALYFTDRILSANKCVQPSSEEGGAA